MSTSVSSDTVERERSFLRASSAREMRRSRHNSCNNGMRLGRSPHTDADDADAFDDDALGAFFASTFLTAFFAVFFVACGIAFFTLEVPIARGSGETR